MHVLAFLYEIGKETSNHLGMAPRPSVYVSAYDTFSALNHRRRGLRRYVDLLMVLHSANS